MGLGWVLGVVLVGFGRGGGRDGSSAALGVVAIRASALPSLQYSTVFLS